MQQLKIMMLSQNCLVLRLDALGQARATIARLQLAFWYHLLLLLRHRHLHASLRLHHSIPRSHGIQVNLRRIRSLWIFQNLTLCLIHHGLLCKIHGLKGTLRSRLSGGGRQHGYLVQILVADLLLNAVRLQVHPFILKITVINLLGSMLHI